MTVTASRFSNGAQIRAGRALLGWRRKDRAKAANLHPNAVAYWERRSRLPSHEEVGCRRIREALFWCVGSTGPGGCVPVLPSRVMGSTSCNGRCA